MSSNKSSFKAVFGLWLLALSLLLAACGDTPGGELALAPTSNVAVTTAVATTASTTTVASATTLAPTTAALATATPVRVTTSPPQPSATAAATIASTASATTAASSTTNAPTALTTAASSTTSAARSEPGKFSKGEVLPFSGQNAYNHVKMLSNDFGIRLAGTEGQRKTGDYIFKQFESFGFKASFQESSPSWQRDVGSSLSVAGESKPIKVRLLYVGTGKPGQSQSEAEIVALNTNNSNTAAVGGKIVIISESNVNLSQIFQQLTNLAEGQRPLAMLLVPNEADPLMPSSVRSAGLTVGYLEQAGGQRLVGQAGQGTLKATLSLNWSNDKVLVRNVIGTRLAADGNKEAPIIIIGGHCDTVPEGPGANDNASGTGTIIELARVLAKAYPAVEFRFIGFDGHEIGLFGSRDYVNKLSATEKRRVLAMFNIDMIAVGQTLGVAGTQNIATIAKGVVDDLKLRGVQVRASERGLSDDGVFVQASIPVLSFNRQSDPNYHRPGDKADQFGPEPLDIVGQIMLGTLERWLTNIQQ